ncbi:unnamed protein product [Rotaria sp. Silwood1]|nr:unnamed protein product [Rotaria sp. Silwood1]CAF4934964.1 unnamed protein product [Rotaria sp. Silwood1]
MTTQEEMNSFILNTLKCPITLELFVDPVVANDGHTYERSAIIEWVQNHNGTSPITRQPIKIDQLKSNRVVKQLADQYRIISMSKIGKTLSIFSGNGTLLNTDQKILIKKLFPIETKWLLIYKGTENGFDSDDFHRYCDNRGATLTLIQARSRFYMKRHDSIFGGFTTIPWSSKHGFYLDPEAFLFLLNSEDIIRFNLRSTDETAISHYATAGPVFGLDDIYICHRPNENNLSYSNFPHCYEDLEKNGKGRKTFSKSKCFLVNEIEVYMTIM